MAGSLIGANLAASITSTTDGKIHGVGDRTTDHSGNEWVYVRSGEAIDAYNCVVIDAAGDAYKVTQALSATAVSVGFAQYAFSASNEYGWVMVRGAPTIRVAAGCAVSVPLYTTNTAGVLDDATASLSHFQVQGVVLASSGSSGGVDDIAGIAASYPIFKRPIGT
jgi:hypothetical protein